MIFLNEKIIKMWEKLYKVIINAARTLAYPQDRGIGPFGFVAHRLTFGPKFRNCVLLQFRRFGM